MPYFTRREEKVVAFYGDSSNKTQEKLLNVLHQDHPGISQMKAEARSYFWWPGLDKSIEGLVKSGQECHTVKNAPTVAPLHPWVWPIKPWQRTHVDFSKVYVPGFLDAHSKLPEV